MQSIVDYCEPLNRLGRSVAGQYEVDLAHEAIMLEDTRQVLAEHRRRTRAETVKDENTGLLKDEEREAEDVGDLHIGPKIEVRQVEAEPPMTQPAKRNGNGLARAAVIALGTVGLLGLGAGATYLLSELFAEDPPAAVQPVEPRDVRITVR